MLSKRLALRLSITAIFIGSTSLAAAQVPNVLIIGDAYTANSQLFANGAYNEMVAAVTSLGGSAANVTQKNFDITGAGGNPTTVTASDFALAGGGRYDLVVLTAAFGGFNAASVSAVQSAIQTRAATSFFLFPDQCSSCAPNIDQITNPIINAATGWGISRGALFNNSALTPTPSSVVLNGATPLASSFSSLDPMAVYDYRALDNVPAYNVLYMPPKTALPGDPSPYPAIAMPTPADVANNTRINNVSALIVPRAQSFNGNGACIFTISDVNPFILPGNPPAGRLGSIMVDAAISPTGSCAAQAGSIAISKTLAPLPAGAPVAWPQNFDFTATCNLPTTGSIYTASVSFNSEGSQTATIANVPEGAVCNLSETQPAAPAAHAWDAAVFSPATVTVIANQTANSTITNRLQTIPPALGTAVITKTLAPLPAGAPVTWPLTFHFTATCDKPAANTIYTTSLNFTAAGSQTATLNTIPDGSNCTLSEALPGAPSGYTWDAPVFSPATISVAGGQSVSTAITNSLRLQANAMPAVAAPVPSNTVASLAAMAALLAVLGIRQRRRTSQGSRT